MPKTRASRSPVLVTGAAGMVGSHLIDALLERGRTVIGVDDLSVGKELNVAHHLKNPRFTFLKLDILDLENLFLSVREAGAIVHLAAAKKIGEQGSGFRTLTVNTKGTETILKLARALKSKVIFGSTSDVYGMSEDLPFREDGDLVLGPSMIKRWSYAVSKLYGEQMVFAFHKEFGVPVVILRYFGAFSERSSFGWSGGHVPLFIEAVLNDQEVIVHGDGKQTRSMGHVSDLVNGTLLALEREEAVGEIINIGNDEELSVIDTARLIHRIAKTGRPLKIKYVPFKDVFGKYKDIQRRLPDLSKARRLLGFRPKVRLREAVELTLAERRRI
ncbi:MAG: NAD-dependent epimerase/dehydratase family protein [Elusimicrobiota bacterium]